MFGGDSGHNVLYADGIPASLADKLKIDEEVTVILKGIVVEITAMRFGDEESKTGTSKRAVGIRYDTGDLKLRRDNVYDEISRSEETDRSE